MILYSDHSETETIAEGYLGQEGAYWWNEIYNALDITGPNRNPNQARHIIARMWREIDRLRELESTGRGRGDILYDSPESRNDD